MAASIFFSLIALGVLAPLMYYRNRQNIYSRATSFNKKNHVALGYYHHNFHYIMTLKGGIVTQKWILNKELFEKQTKNFRFDKKKQLLKLQLEKLKELNKYGVKVPHRSTYYPGIVEYKLTRDKKLPGFTREDFAQFKKLRSNHRMLNVADHFDAALVPEAWNNAYLRRDLYYGMKGMNQEEQKEFKELILKKYEYVDKYLKFNAFSPLEDQFAYVFDVQRGLRSKDYGDYINDQDMERFQGQLPSFTEKHSQVLTQDNGVYVGGGLRFPSQGHFVTIGASRKGKGTNLIIPHLLEPEKFDGSQIIMDIKGELAAICAGYLKSVGKKVIILDPWDMQKNKAIHGIQPSSFNPIEFLRKDDPYLVDNCKEVAANLVAFGEDDNEFNHWVEKARDWVSYYLLWMVTNGEDVTLTNLRSLFSYGEEKRSELFADMQAYGKFEAIRQNGSILSDIFLSAPKEATGILSTVLRAVDTFASPTLEKATSTSDFDINQIVNGDYYIFLCIPQSMLKTNFRWLRLVIGSTVKVALNSQNKRVLVIMDEFKQLGRMPIVENGFAIMAGHNMSFWIIIQGIEQLKDVYKGNAWETFFTNAAVTTWIGVEGMQSATYLSNLLGRRQTMYKSNDVIIKELSESKIFPAQRQELRPQTEAQIRQSEQIYVLVSGLAPIAVDRKPYYETDLNKRADQNPFRSKNN